MKVQQINTQSNDLSYAGAAQNDDPGMQSHVTPVKFDTSSDGDAQYSNHSDVSSVPDSALTPPARGEPGTSVEQNSPDMVTHWRRDDQGKPVLQEVNPTQRSDGSPGNVATEFKLDPNGKPVLVGAHPVERPMHDTSQDRTAGDVFLDGFKEGATHPGRFFGKLADEATGDTSGTNQKRGEEADKILEKTPVVGTALTITGGIAGERNPDGSPKLATPDVQPDVPENTFGGRLGIGRAGQEAEVPLTKASPSTQVKPAARDGAPGTSKEPQTGTPPAHEPGTNAPVTKGAKFDVPEQYARKPSGDLHADPDTKGVSRDDKGQSYIDVSGKTYPVRYDKDNGTLRVYNPDDPAKVQYPVKQDEHGDWQVHNDVGLKGGGSTTVVPHNLLARRTELENQRQQLQHEQHEVQEQIRQFPGPQHAGRSGMELAYLDHALRGRLTDVNNRLQNVHQQLQEVQHEIQLYN